MAILWLKDLDSAFADAKSSRKPALAYFSASPFCGGCMRLDAEVYANPRAEEYINKTFVPVLIHMKDQPAMFDRFKAQLTPTILIFDLSGNERHRLQGFLPVDEFLQQLKLGADQSGMSDKS